MDPLSSVFRRRTRGVLTGVLLWCTLSGVALAEGPTADDPFERAGRAFSEGRFVEAHRLYLEAWAGRESYRTAAGLGQVELRLGRYRDAAEHLDYCLRHYPADADAEARRSIQRGYDEAVKQVGALQIVVDPAGAKLSVDGRDYGDGPFPLVFVRPGRHEVVAALEGYRTESQTIRATAGSTRELSFRLRPASGSEATAVPSETGGAERTAAPGGDGGRTVVLVVGAGLTAVALGVGVGYRLKGASENGSAEDLLARAEGDFGPSPCAGAGRSSAACRDLKSTLDDRNDANAISNVSLVAAAVLGGATAVTFFLWPSGTGTGKPSAALGIEPRWSPGGGSLSLSGSF